MRLMTSLLWSCVSQTLRMKPKAARRHQRLRICSELESLEKREVMAASPVIAISKQVLQITGTDGIDTTTVHASGNQITVSVTTKNGTTEQTFDRSKFKQIEFRGLAGDDDFTNSTNIKCKAFGGDGDDTLMGGLGTSTLSGEQGNDILIGGDLADSLSGGDGDDFLLCGGGNDKAVGGNGDDQLIGENGADDLSGDGGNDRVSGDDGKDTLKGGAGSDSLTGNAGNDSLQGGDGDDQLTGGDNNDTLTGGQGMDSMYGGAGNDRLDGNDGDDLLSGESGNDSVAGSAGTDWLYGGEGNDTLNGGVASDNLDSGLGTDRVTFDSKSDFWTRNSTYSGPSAGPDFGSLTDEELAPIIDEAFQRWDLAGLDLIGVQRPQFRIADLPDGHLAWAIGSGADSTLILIDHNADSNSWYAGVSADRYTVSGTADGLHQMDLLTVIMHEIGHVAGFEHSESLDVMTPFLVPNVRLFPADLLPQVTSHDSVFLEMSQRAFGLGTFDSFIEDNLNNSTNPGNNALRQTYASSKALQLLRQGGDDLAGVDLGGNSLFAEAQALEALQQTADLGNFFSSTSNSTTGFGAASDATTLLLSLLAASSPSYATSLFSSTGGQTASDAWQTLSSSNILGLGTLGFNQSGAGFDTYQTYDPYYGSTGSFGGYSTYVDPSTWYTTPIGYYVSYDGLITPGGYNSYDYGSNSYGVYQTYVDPWSNYTTPTGYNVSYGGVITPGGYGSSYDYGYNSYGYGSSSSYSNYGSYGYGSYGWW